MSLFEGTAQFYRRYRPEVPADVAEVLLRAVPDRRPRRLLDIGTGTGLVVQALRDSVHLAGVVRCPVAEVHANAPEV